MRPSKVAVAVALLVMTSSAAAGCSSSTKPPASGSATTSASGADPCSILTPDVVQAALDVAVTTPPAAVGCQYDGPDGLLLSATTAQLPSADQAAFDAYLKEREPGSLVPLTGIGDGTGATAAHDANVTTYARKGRSIVSITMFEAASTAAADGQTLAALLTAKL